MKTLDEELEQLIAERRVGLIEDPLDARIARLRKSVEAWDAIHEYQTGPFSWFVQRFACSKSATAIWRNEMDELTLLMELKDLRNRVQ